MNEHTLEDLGYSAALEQYKQDHQLHDFEIGRVILEHKERYTLKAANGEFEAELMGNLRFSATNRYDFPAVGDWVAFSEYDDNKGLIHAIYPRHSIIERQAVGKMGQTQIIATNVDYGLLVQAVDRDFNLNRFERYLTICYASRVNPIIVLSKIDLIEAEELEELVAKVVSRIPDVPVLTVSHQPSGYKALESFIEKGKTYCLLGSSGVGKSTLLNGLLGRLQMETGQISDSNNKGKHVTTHRELTVLHNGGILIDNPGMREVGITDASGGLETTFDTILDLGENCRFRDCTHQHEKGCAIIEAAENGEIDEDSYANFRKMLKEQAHFEADVHAKKRKDKSLGKLIKQMKKQNKSGKY